MKIKKAVILVGGLGSRMAPISRVVAKEMLPIIDKPVLEYLIDDLYQCGITEVLFVCHKDKVIIQNYFTNSKISFYYVYPDAPMGVSDALLHAEKFTKNEDFILLYGDVLFYSRPSSIKQMLNMYHKYKLPIVASRRVEKSKVGLYGCVDYDIVNGNKYIKTIIEKPQIKDAPSNIVLTGQYVLNKKIYSAIKELKDGQLFTDALVNVSSEHKLMLVNIKGHYFDIGNKAGFLSANIYFSLKNKLIKNEIYDFLEKNFNKN